MATIKYNGVNSLTYFLSKVKAWASGKINGLIYDVSALHPTSGVNGGSTYASLPAALAVIPQEKRRGGMTVKFVLSSDNTYAQYLYMSSDATTVATFTNTANWQKMNLEWELNTESIKFGLQDLSVNDKALSKINGVYTLDNRYKASALYKVSAGDKIIYNGEVASQAFAIIACFDSSRAYLQAQSVAGNTITTNVDYVFTVPSGVSYVAFCARTDNNKFKYIRLSTFLSESIQELDNTTVKYSDIVQGKGAATNKVMSQKATTDAVNDLMWHTILADELLQGTINGTGQMALTGYDSRLVSLNSYTVPKNRKVDVAISGTLPTTVRFAGYDKDMNFVSGSLTDITTLTDGKCSLDLSGSPTIDSVRICLLFANATTPAMEDGKAKITIDMASVIEDSIREKDYLPTDSGSVEILYSTALINGLPDTKNSYRTYSYTEFDAEYIDVVSYLNFAGNNHVSFFNDIKASAETLISTHDSNLSVDVLHLRIPESCKMVMVSNLVSAFDRFEVIFRKKNLTSTLSEDVNKLTHNGIRESFDEEAIRVTNDAIAYDCDLRFLVFADPHTLDEESYLKYNAINEKGVVDFILGVGDYNPYEMIERNTLKQGINKVLTLAGKRDNCIYAVGNHDVMANFNWIWATGAFAEVQPKISTDYIFTKKEQFEMTTRHLSNRAVFNENDPYGCYYYIDYEPQKVRVIVLNASDIFEDDGTLQYFYVEQMMLHQEQMTWYANKALDFSDKSNSSEWSVMVVLHHHYMSTIVPEILGTAMNGESINKTWRIQRRRVYDETTHKYTKNLIPSPDGIVSISINKDYSTQGQINVLGIFFGHSHNDVTRDSVYGFKTFEFVSDNGDLCHLIKAPIANGLTAGNYWFETERGSIVQLQIAEALPDARSISYNKYFDTTSSTRAEVHIYDGNGQTIWFKESAPTVETGTGTEITGFVDSETALTLEKCSIVCVNKETRTIKIFPYGGADYREVSY